MTGDSRAHLPALGAVVATAVGAQEAPGSVYNLAAFGSNQMQPLSCTQQAASQPDSALIKRHLDPVNQSARQSEDACTSNKRFG